MSHPVREYFAIEDYTGPPLDPGPMPELGEPGAEPRERWKRIALDGLLLDYEISDYGRVVNPKGQLLKIGYPGSSSTGWIGLPKAGDLPTDAKKTGHYRVDKLVLAMFSEDPPDSTMVPKHINGDLTDSRLDNLVWALPKTVKAQSTDKQKKTRTRRKRTTTKRAPRVKKHLNAVEVTRVYRFRDLTLEIGLDGDTKLAKGSNTMHFTAEQFSALVSLVTQAGEMNAMLGLK